MNNTINVLLVLAILISMSIGFVWAIRVKQQFGFIAPMGFMCAVLLQKICFAAVLPMYSHFAVSMNHETFRETASKLSGDDRLFYLGIGGQADGIWHLGAILFLFCGLLDLKAASGAATGRCRFLLIIGGTLFMLFSVIYPSLMLTRLR